ncbi:uncharacterized protein LOC101846639 [Aplysia californica]|uniref:Uncharacterized protein LOC101846639 n=1 Tax=Aplysia californica TaxID=6500 RepID=A0ABM0JJF2_APLCA|nr:uncharacterized protein LOC101846639 [Aplysia californica]
MDTERIVQEIVAASDVNVITRRMVREKYKEVRGLSVLSPTEKKAVNAVVESIVLQLGNLCNSPENEKLQIKQASERSQTGSDVTECSEPSGQSSSENCLNMSTGIVGDTSIKEEVDSEAESSSVSEKQQEADHSFVLDEDDQSSPERPCTVEEEALSSDVVILLSSDTNFTNEKKNNGCTKCTCQKRTLSELPGDALSTESDSNSPRLRESAADAVAEKTPRHRKRPKRLSAREAAAAIMGSDSDDDGRCVGLTEDSRNHCSPIFGKSLNSPFRFKFTEPKDSPFLIISPDSCPDPKRFLKSNPKRQMLSKESSSLVISDVESPSYTADVSRHGDSDEGQALLCLKKKLSVNRVRRSIVVNSSDSGDGDSSSVAGLVISDRWRDLHQAVSRSGCRGFVHSNLSAHGKDRKYWSPKVRLQRLQLFSDKAGRKEDIVGMTGNMGRETTKKCYRLNISSDSEEEPMVKNHKHAVKGCDSVDGYAGVSHIQAGTLNKLYDGETCDSLNVPLSDDKKNKKRKAQSQNFQKQSSRIVTIKQRRKSLGKELNGKTETVEARQSPIATASANLRVYDLPSSSSDFNSGSGLVVTPAKDCSEPHTVVGQASSGNGISKTKRRRLFSLSSDDENKADKIVTIKQKKKPLVKEMNGKTGTPSVYDLPSCSSDSNSMSDLEVSPAREHSEPHTLVNGASSPSSSIKRKRKKISVLSSDDENNDVEPVLLKNDNFLDRNSVGQGFQDRDGSCENSDVQLVTREDDYSSDRSNSERVAENQDIPCISGGDKNEVPFRRNGCSSPGGSSSSDSDLEHVKPTAAHSKMEALKDVRNTFYSSPLPPEKASKRRRKKQVPDNKAHSKVSGGLSKQLVRLRAICRHVGLVLRNQRELSGCVADSEKIDRIRQLLRDRGMKGRPTMKKAEELKLQRELQDLVSGDGGAPVVESRLRGKKKKVVTPQQEKKSRSLWKGLEHLVSSEASD